MSGETINSSIRVNAKLWEDFKIWCIKNKVSINESKIKIIKFLLIQDFLKEKTTISDISKNTKLDYKNTWRYLEQLEQFNLIELETHKKTQGKKKYLSLNTNHTQPYKNIQGRFTHLFNLP